MNVNGFKGLVFKDAAMRMLGFSVYGVLVLMGAGVCFAARWIPGDPAILLYWTKEGGFFESIGAICLGLAGGGLLWRSWQKRIGSTACLFGVLLVLAALEEVSWGQHLFGFLPPEPIMEMNRQKEMNLHNLLPAPLFGFLVNFSVYLLFVWCPLFLRFFPDRIAKSMERVGIRTDLHLVALFLGGFAFQAYFLLDTLTDTAALLASLVLGIREAVRSGKRWAVLHFCVIALLVMFLMTCAPVFGYANLQYEIREMLFAIGILIVSLSCFPQDSVRRSS